MNRKNDLQKALDDPKWKDHEIGDLYVMINRDRSESSGWKIAYYPLFGTYKNEKWIEFNEPRALIERPMKKGTDFREVAFIYLTNQNTEDQ
jgi:hypothetical protein